MHRTSQFLPNENQGRNVFKKNISSISTKPRALLDVGNVLQPKAELNASKASAAERQRANAEKLAKGQSVVDARRLKTEKENLVAKENVKSSFRPFGSRDKRTTVFRDIGANFKAPVRPLKAKKPDAPALKKSESSVSLQSLLPEIKVEEAPATEVAAALSNLKIQKEPKSDNDPFLLGSFSRDIYEYLMTLETQQIVRQGYLTKAHMMTEGMRPVLVDWMYDVNLSFDLHSETVQIAIALLDRYLQDTPKVPKDELQLVGVTCIFVASKYEEINPPGVDDLVQISANACTKEQIIRTEKRILKTLEFNIGRAPPIQFLRHYCRLAGVSILVYNFSKYFVDLALVQYSFCHLPPSLLAASAVYLGVFLTSDVEKITEKLWTPLLVQLTTYKFEEVESVVLRLAKLIVTASHQKQKSVQNMYANIRKLGGVSARPELGLPKLKNLAALQS